MQASAPTSPSIKLLIFFFLYAAVWTLGLGFSLNLGQSDPILHLHCGDQHIFTIIAQGVIDGKEIYTDLWDHKGPLLFLLYVPFLWITGGDQHMALYIAQLVSSFVVLLYSWKLARLYLSEKLAFLLIVLIPATLGSYSANITDLLVSLQVLSLYYFIRKYKTGDSRSILLVLGACTTVLLYSKFILCAYWMPFFFVELYQLWKNNGKKTVMIELLKCSAAFAIISAVIFSIVSPQLTWDTYIEFNKSYGSQQTSIILSDPVEVLSRLIWPHPIGLQLLFYVHIPAVMLGLALLLSSFIIWPQYKKSLICIIPCFIAMLMTLIAAAATPVMRDYYYISLHPFFILSLIFILYWAPSILGKIIKERKLQTCIYGATIAAIFLALTAFMFRFQSETRAAVHHSNLLNQYVAEHIEMKSEIISIGFSPTYFDLYHELDTLPLSPYFFQPFIPEDIFCDFKNSTLQLIKDGVPEHVILPQGDSPEIYEQLLASPIYQKQDIPATIPSATWEHFVKKVPIVSTLSE